MEAGAAKGGEALDEFAVKQCEQTEEMLSEARQMWTETLESNCATLGAAAAISRGVPWQGVAWISDRCTMQETAVIGFVVVHPLAATYSTRYGQAGLGSAAPARAMFCPRLVS